MYEVVSIQEMARRLTELTEMRNEGHKSYCPSEKQDSPTEAMEVDSQIEDERKNPSPREFLRS